jgi:hypothetical protein
MGALPQALEIVFEVQRKKSNEKTTKRKISFPSYQTLYFLLSSLWTPLTFKSHNFLISYLF